MKAIKTRAVRPQTRSLRKRFLQAEVTPEELAEIKAYCRRKRISVSQFVADLLLQDAIQPKGKPPEKVTLKPELELTPQQLAKLEVLTRLHQKKSVSEYILDVLEPQLELQRRHVPVKAKLLRYYLSDEEHAIVSRHLAGSGLSPNTYAGMLILRTVRKDKKKG